jgi:hypothetical protein
MKRIVYINAAWIFALVFVAMTLIISAGYAQMHLGGTAKVASPPIPLQTIQIRPQPAMPNLALALIGPAAIGAATTTNLFAQVAVGGGYTTVFSFINTGADATTGNLILTGDSGAPLAVNFSSPDLPGVLSASFPISIPSGGAGPITAGPVSPADPVKTGWARVESAGGSLGGVATFQFAANGILQTVVGVLSAIAVSEATIPVDDDLTLGGQSRRTGFAIANPGSTDINIKIVLVNPNGSVSQSITPGALNPLHSGQHVSRFLDEVLGNPSLKFRGSIALIEPTGKSFSVVALVLNSGQLTAIPVISGKAPGVN